QFAKVFTPDRPRGVKIKLLPRAYAAGRATRLRAKAQGCMCAPDSGKIGMRRKIDISGIGGINSSSALYIISCTISNSAQGLALRCTRDINRIGQQVDVLRPETAVAHKSAVPCVDSGIMHLRPLRVELGEAV